MKIEPVSKGPRVPRVGYARSVSFDLQIKACPKESIPLDIHIIEVMIFEGEYANLQCLWDDEFPSAGIRGKDMKDVLRLDDNSVLQRG